MSTAETDETRSAYGDGAGELPDAPKPLSVLEVLDGTLAYLHPLFDSCLGRRRIVSTRH